jgi:DNA adenine methylase
MNSFISWIGGKKLLKKEIINRFPEKFNRYIEVFGGAGWVLFGKDKIANMEVYNDYNSDLVNLFRCVKFHCGELQRELSFMLNSRELFYDFANQYNTRGMTDIQRAARFFMLIKTSYGSDQRSYGCVKKNINVMIQYLTDIQERLSNVVIENKDFENLIKVYDKSDSLIYLDPPYFGTERYYQVEFSEEDHIRLYNCVKKIRGKFILSYNDCEFIKNLYKDFNIDQVERNNNLIGRYNDKKHTYNELIIRNY